mmetsp:Transcript_26443/g.67128  ORF Transcript_26443/g.67128 Transcript_26443/m.67128 type:complete len:92 (+) Transcript_26443:160-435(+)
MHLTTQFRTMTNQPKQRLRRGSRSPVLNDRIIPFLILVRAHDMASKIIMVAQPPSVYDLMMVAPPPSVYASRSPLAFIILSARSSSSLADF